MIKRVILSKPVTDNPELPKSWGFVFRGVCTMKNGHPMDDHHKSLQDIKVCDVIYTLEDHEFKVWTGKLWLQTDFKFSNVSATELREAEERSALKDLADALDLLALS